jgi:hypothetical protein
MRLAPTSAIAAAIALALAGCVSTQVADLGGGHYLVQGAATEYNSGQQVTGAMIAKAHDYCRARGQQARIELDHQREESGVTGWVSRPASGQLSFRCEGEARRPATTAAATQGGSGQELDSIEQGILKMCLARAKGNSTAFRSCYDENLATYRGAR